MSNPIRHEPLERYAPCATMITTRNGQPGEWVRAEDAECRIAALEARNKELEEDNAEEKACRMAEEEQLAAILPEDVGAVEYIQHLEARATKAEAALSILLSFAKEKS